MYQAITFVSTLLAVILILFIFKNKSEKSFSKFLKILTVIFCVMGFFRFMLSDSFVLVIKGGYFNNKYYDKQDILQSIIRWGYYIGYSVLPMAVFFKNRFFRNITSYLFLPFAILSAVFIDDYMVYFLSPEGFGLHLVPWIRYAYFIVELTLSMAIPIVLQIKEKHVLNVKDKKELIYFLVGIPLILLQVMPVYTPQSLLGYTGVEIHLPWLIIIAIETICLYYFFRFGFQKDKLAFLAKEAFMGQYTDEVIEKWLNVFLKRFFISQFKRSCSPDAPKVGSVSLSPRGDLRMPSDADFSEWVK